MMLKRTGSVTGHGVLLAGAALMTLTVSGYRAYAQEMPQEPAVAVTAPAPDVVAQPGLPVDPNLPPVTGAPSALAPQTPEAPGAPAEEMQSASGTYEEMDPAALIKLDEAMASMAILRKDNVKPQEVGTLLFTLWQHALLQDAKRLYEHSGVPTQAEIDAAANASAGQAKPRGVRELGLSGILYKGSDNWVVWLNGKRIAPDAIPREIIDIKVAKDYIDLKWFDAYTNLIYPVRMRPHQRFNLDTRIFLPGITADAAAQLQSATAAQ